jgi:CHAT domain-containing protein
VLTGLDATKANFLSLAKSYDIIDLATHGIADSSNSLDSRLFFSVDGSGDSILYLSELYNLKLPIRLAILEACETGTGDFNQGEGVTSLARGFTYAGCRSILMSLWQVPEGSSTSEIMEEFYHQMAAGKPLDEAIVLAKRQYLKHLKDEGGGNLWKMHPFFWAELVLIGDKQAIKMAPPQSSQASYYTIFGAIATFLALAALGVFFRRKFKAA